MSYHDSEKNILGVNFFIIFTCSPTGATFTTPLAFNNQQLSDLMRNFMNGQSGCCSYLALLISEPHEEAQ